VISNSPQTAPAAAGRIVTEAGNATVRVLETEAEVERHRGLWEALEVRNVAADVDWLLAWCRLAPETERPHVLVVEEDGEDVGLAVGRIERVRRPLHVRGRKVMTTAARRLIVAHEGVVGSAADRHAALVMQAWWQALRDGEADAVSHRLEADSPLHVAARAHDSFWQHSRMERPLTRFLLRLPEDFAAFMSARSSDSRRKLRNADKRRRERFGVDPVIRCYRDPDDHALIIRELEDISTRSSKHAEGRGFRSDEHIHGMLRLALERGWYRVWIMYAGDKPIAWCDGELYRGTFYTADGIGTTGYDGSPEYRDLSLGTAVMLGMFEGLCAEPDAEVIDFAAGPWEYKRRWSNESVDEVQFVLYAPRPWPMAISLARKAASALAERIDRARANRT
jgi:CelD/BcsL family acetyltransferase involved in cellulose biosynthesis